jgi:TolB-like protein
VASWVVIQVVSALNSPLSLPDWFERVVIVLLAIGLPIAVVLAWAFELTPEGIKPTQPGSSDASAGSKLDYALIAALVAVVAVTLWSNQSARQGQDTAVSAPPGAPPSIAVLPFVDMSPNGDQEYFGDGIAEELLNELVRLDGLRVAGRTSSFAYKGSNQDLQSIGNAMKVSSILEGSVRKDGDRIRITAQLIDVANGFHQWSETYDRELTDIFAIQQDIASSVAGALGVRLGVGGVNAFMGAGTNNVEAYELYLQAYGMPALGQSEVRIEMLERVVAMDPGYAAAWAALGLTMGSRMWISQPDAAPAILDRAFPHVLRAIELNPDSAFAHSLIATMYYPRQEWILAQEHNDRAVALRRTATSIGNFANMLMRAGRISAAQRNYDEVAAVDPLRNGRNSLRVNAYLAERKFDEARRLLDSQIGRRQNDLYLEISLNEGNDVAVRETLLSLGSSSLPAREIYSDVVRSIDSGTEVPDVLRAHLDDPNNLWPSKYHDIAILAAYFDDPELALAAKSNEVRYTPTRQGALWQPVMAEVRRLPGFKDLMHEINIVEYWREYGWPEACQPRGADDFICE